MRVSVEGQAGTAEPMATPRAGPAAPAGPAAGTAPRHAQCQPLRAQPARDTGGGWWHQ